MGRNPVAKFQAAINSICENKSKASFDLAKLSSEQIALADELVSSSTQMNLIDVAKNHNMTIADVIAQFNDDNFYAYVKAAGRCTTTLNYNVAISRLMTLVHTSQGVEALKLFFNLVGDTSNGHKEENNVDNRSIHIHLPFNRPAGQVIDATLIDDGRDKDA